MTNPRHTISFGQLSHNAAHALSDAVDSDLRFDPLASSVNETDERTELWEAVFYFESLGECRTLAQAYPDHATVIAALPDTDWVRQSLLGLSPVVAGRYFVHGSHDRARRRTGGVSLEIDAGTAFGTGHHGTTTACLLALDAIAKRSRPGNVFDLGCGTGVLALAAAKTFRTRTSASDIDPEAVRVTVGNARLNESSPHIVCVTAPGLHHRLIRRRAPYDLIFANILARPLEKLASGLSRLVAPQGSLILSGLTLNQERWIRACYRNRGLVFERAWHIDGWCALQFRRK
jgi:ribosomal protein L11 methyltransferase